jgi:homoserine O-acetyltransferase
MHRRFVEVVRPRLLCVALARRFGSRYYAAPADSQSAVAVNGGGAEVSQLNLVKDFKGRERDSFPCLSRIREKNGPLKKMRGSYGELVEGYEIFTHKDKFHFKHGGYIPRLDLAYETWGELNDQRSNAILLFTGISASSHACSTQSNSSKGWWEEFIGPGRALDTNKFFVVCANVLGGCYGSSGPSSTNPTTGERYAMTFPLVSIEDMIRAQFLLLDDLGVSRLHASVGASLGGMQSIMSAALYPDRVGRVISISSCLQTHPSSIAMRYVQRQILMGDPDWKDGQYYDISFPRMGMQHARVVGMIAYRSGPEWEQRFGHKRRDMDSPPDFCQDFEIEYYLDKQGERFCEAYDPNSLLYISKAMDLFDMSDGYSSLEEGVSRVTCPVLVSHMPCTGESHALYW